MKADKISKRILLISIAIIILIGASSFQTSASGTKMTGIFDNIRILKSNSTIEVSLDVADIPSNPIDLNKTIEVDVDVKLTGELPKFFPKLFINTKIGNWIIFRDKNQNSTVNVTLSVASPDWCTAKLEHESIEIDLLSNSKKSTKLYVTIKESALALQEGEIELKADFSPPENWMFGPSKDTTNFTIVSKYVGNITAVIEPLDGVDSFIVKPNVNTTLPLNITNNFNGETKVTIDFDNDSSDLNWNVSLDQDEILIPKDDTKTVNIIIKPPSSKKMQEITGTFILKPKSTVDIKVADEYLAGESIEISTGPIVKEKIEEEFEIDTTMLAIILLIIILVIIVIIVFLKRK